MKSGVASGRPARVAGAAVGQRRAESSSVDDRIRALDAELRSLRLACQTLQQEAAKARGAIKMIGAVIDAHETLLLSVVDVMPGVEADVDAALTHPSFAELVGASAVTQIREFRRRLDWWRALVEAGQRPDDVRAH